MNSNALLQKLATLPGLTDDERAALTAMLATKKKYGLIWEDKPEAVEEQLRTALPVLEEVAERRIPAGQPSAGGNDGDGAARAGLSGGPARANGSERLKSGEHGLKSREQTFEVGEIHFNTEETTLEDGKIKSK